MLKMKGRLLSYIRSDHKTEISFLTERKPQVVVQGVKVDSGGVFVEFTSTTSL